MRKKDKLNGTEKQNSPKLTEVEQLYEPQKINISLNIYIKIRDFF